MRIIVAGAHGQVGIQLLPMLVADGHHVLAMVRVKEQAIEVSALGADAVICDLEAEPDFAQHMDGVDVAIFAAGAGQKSTIDRKWTVDYGAAVKLIDSSTHVQVSQFVMLSSIGAHDPTSLGEQRIPYLTAKRDADEALARSGLHYAIVRPGFLNNEPGTGQVEVTQTLGQYLSVDPAVRRQIARADVAAVLRECIRQRVTGATFEVFGGTAPVAKAVGALSPR